MFVDLDWPLNASSLLSASAELLVLYPRPITLAKRYLQFYRCRCHGPYMLDKTNKIFIFNICCFCTTSVVLMLVFSQYLSKIQICAYFYIHIKNLVKIRRSATELLRIFNFQNGGHLPSWILNFHNFCQKFKLLLISHRQNLVKIRRSAAKLFRVFKFQMMAVHHLGL